MYSADVFEMDAFLDEISHCAPGVLAQAEEFACKYRTWLDEAVLTERTMTSRTMAICFCGTVGAQARYQTFSFYYFSKILYGEKIKAIMLKLHGAAAQFKTDGSESSTEARQRAQAVSRYSVSMVVGRLGRE